MLHTLIAFLLSAVVQPPQVPALTAADVQAIEAAVVEDLAPATGSVGARPTKGRMLLVDHEQMSVVMRKIAGEPLRATLEIPRAFRAAGRAAAIQCARPPRGDCQVANDGIYMTISDAAVMPSTGELRVHAAVAWTHAGLSEHELNGYEVDLYLVRSAAGWRIARRGPPTVG